MDKGDVMDRDPTKIPDVVACLNCPDTRAVQKYAVKDTQEFALVTYGLCERCKTQLERDPGYKAHLNKVLTKRLNKLKEGEKDGTGNT